MFCDWFLEFAKPSFAAELRAATAHVLGVILRLMHPAMPFVTATLWGEFGFGEAAGLIHAPWPEPQPVPGAAEARADLGTRTIFNLLGPLANPARVRRQLIGVFDRRWARPMAETLANLGCDKAWLVHGQGLDELTVAGENHVVELGPDGIREFTLTPEQAGLSPAPIEAIMGGDATANAAALTALLDGTPGAYRDTVVLNAAAGLIVAGRAGDVREGAVQAMQSIDEGAARHALARLRAATA